MEIQNDLLTSTYKETKLERFNYENDPINNIKWFEFTIKIKWKINDNLK